MEKSPDSGTSFDGIGAYFQGVRRGQNLHSSLRSRPAPP